MGDFGGGSSSGGGGYYGRQGEDQPLPAPGPQNYHFQHVQNEDGEYIRKQLKRRACDFHTNATLDVEVRGELGS